MKMAPKKNIDKTPTLGKKAKEKKAPKPRIKKEKPQLRIPTVVKVKIPSASLALNKNGKKKKNVDTKKEEGPKHSLKQLAALTKLELANEVARAQLVKNPPEVKSEVVTSPEPVKKLPPKSLALKRRGRPKSKNVTTDSMDTTTVSCPTDSEEAFDMTPKKRKYVKKVPLPNAAAKKKPVLIRNRKAPEKKTVQAKKNLKQTKITDLNTGLVRTPNKNVESTNKPVKAKVSKSDTKPPRRRMPTKKGKPATDTLSSSDAQQSPSLLERLLTISPRKDDTVEHDLKCESPLKENIEAGTIDSRKTSMTGASDLSWTKDISNSSTTTCVTVCSTDFVRIDNKIPVLKLTNIEHTNKTPIPNNAESSSSSDSSDSESSSSSEFTPKTPERETSPDIESHSVDLSTSSVTPSKSLPNQRSPTYSERNDDINVINTALDRLTANLKKFDLEIMNWIGYDKAELNIDVKQFHEKTFRVLKEESEVIAHCQSLKQVLSDVIDVPNDVNENAHEVEDLHENSAAVPIATNDNTLNEHNNHTNENHSPQKVASEKSEDSEYNFTSDKVRYTSFEQNYDDDDTLSLFAESITGMESCKMNSSVTSENPIQSHFEEYIPQPLLKEKCEPASKISYVPSKIVSNSVQTQDTKKTVCEKQRADSTSITKEIEPDKTFTSVNFQNTLDATTSNNENNDSSQHNKSVTVENKKMPCLMSSLYKSLHGVKSVVFRGVCFYNLISGCKNPRCRFPHIVPDHNNIQMKLVRLSEELFIQEYMMLRNWPGLRRAYGMCFVEECKRRELTRILVEMAIDFYMKANDHYREDARLKVIVTECTLLYLNAVDLSTCEDLLLFSVQQGALLCDVFMKTIADTQNFSRFKQVFINLTKFIVDHNRTFNLEVATHILERVCILPYEQPLSEALLEIVKHTDYTIFENSMMGTFEKQLSILAKDLYEKFLVLKKEASLNRPVLKNLFESSPRLNLEIEPLINTTSVHTEREKRYTSPDTTNLDNMNKPTEETVFTRTIDFNRLRQLNLQRPLSNSNSPVSNESTEEGRQVMAMPAPKFQNWRGQTVLHKLRGIRPPQGPLQGVPQGSYISPQLIKRRIHQMPNHGPSPSLTMGINKKKFPRRSGPDFF